MDRSLSVDDLVGNIWRLGQANSDQQFSDLYKTFPSTNSLGGEVAGTSQNLSTDGQPNPDAQSQDGSPSEQQPSSGSGLAAGQQVGVSGSVDALGVGMPRVASLEFLKQFFVNPPLNQAQQQGVKKEMPVALPMSTAHVAQSHPQVDLTTLPNVLNANNLAALSAMPGLQAGGGQNPLLAAGLSPAAAAAALQLSQLSGLAPQPMDRESLEKAEQRRARRMLSNRESARRSRRRKQEHLTNMESEISGLNEEKRKWLEHKDLLEHRCHVAEEESRKLREENQRLRDELRILGLVKEELAEQRRRRLKRDRLEEDASPHGEKRMKESVKEEEKFASAD
ncbi:hypothetical protein BSKO_00357 [Bryopsis sp. KO-2023]|nr:hypothetical protein BSKO_00357 [Bryopsis sp. KO-2023]